MLKYLEPQIVLVYGPMPENIFAEHLGKTQFVHFDDWTTLKKKESAYSKGIKFGPPVSI